MTNRLVSKAEGSLLGLAIGDALGTTLEFKARDHYTPLTDMVGGGPFKLKAGEWTDDTSMALCLAESLLDCKRHEPVDQLRRYLRWRDEGDNSVTGRCFDIGRTVDQALQNFKRGQQAYPGCQDEFSAGNGSLMRLAPIALFYSTHVSRREPASAGTQHLLEMAALSSMTTHRHPLAVAACKVMALLIDHAIGQPVTDCQQRDKTAILSFSVDERSYLGRLPPPIADIVAGSYQGKSRDEVASSGYVVDSLEAALWAFWHGTDFAEGALLAANLGGDADTIAAIYGQLAGAYYGVEGIPSTWLNKLAWQERIRGMAQQLFAPCHPRLPQANDVRALLEQMQAVVDQDAETQGSLLMDLAYACGLMQADYLDQAVVRSMAWVAPHEWEAASSGWDLEACCYLLTALVRSVRFSSIYGADGMACEIRNGRLAILLHRMANLIDFSSFSFSSPVEECHD